MMTYELASTRSKHPLLPFIFLRSGVLRDVVAFYRRISSEWCKFWTHLIVQLDPLLAEEDLSLWELMLQMDNESILVGEQDCDRLQCRPGLFRLGNMGLLRPNPSY